MVWAVCCCPDVLRLYASAHSPVTYSYFVIGVATLNNTGQSIHFAQPLPYKFIQSAKAPSRCYQDALERVAEAFSRRQEKDILRRTHKNILKHNPRVFRHVKPVDTDTFTGRCAWLASGYGGACGTDGVLGAGG